MVVITPIITPTPSSTIRLTRTITGNTSHHGDSSTINQLYHLLLTLNTFGRTHEQH
jgi:hypothetical protein